MVLSAKHGSPKNNGSKRRYRYAINLRGLYKICGIFDLLVVASELQEHHVDLPFNI